MSLTTEQVRQNAKRALIGLPIALGLTVLSGLSGIVLGAYSIILVLASFVLFVFCGCYLVYLQVKYPEAVREISEPHNKARGGMLSDTLSGMDEQVINSKLGNLGRSAKSSEPAIKIRCQSCGHLNDETDKFCGECGAKM